ncbi:MAG TPA: flagellar biosynthesis anti-sigma factor FlgM [Geomonas sp.]|nr:flagellar biosynthesis anti-sigma factor FlgM [Geomonas sp.]
MKIDELNQQMAAAYLTTSRADRQQEAGDTHSESAARQQRGTDTVNLSRNIPVAVETRDPQAARAGRVGEIQSQVASGTYKVPAQAVAEKMLTKNVIPSS